MKEKSCFNLIRKSPKFSFLILGLFCILFVVLGVFFIYQSEAKSRVVIVNPYTSLSNQYMGNLHAHSSNSSGVKRSPNQVRDWYTSHSFGFYTISDHNKVTTPPSNAKPTTINLGYTQELSYSGDKTHILLSGGDSASSVSNLSTALSNNNIVVVNHYGDRGYPASDEAILKTPGVTGMEVCNGKRQEAGFINSLTTEWDKMLNQGYRLWGFGADDSHDNSQSGTCHIRVGSSNSLPLKQDLVASIRSGNFYASRGGVINTVATTPNNYINVNTNGSKIKWIQNGRDMGATVGGTASYDPMASGRYDRDAKVNYVRFEVLNSSGSSIAWSQPLYIRYEFVPTTTQPKPVYRFRNPQNGNYIWTMDDAEANGLIKSNWIYEGDAYRINTKHPKNNVSLWRFYNKINGEYFYTADINEKNTLVNNTVGLWRLDGEAYKVSTDPKGYPVYRFVNATNGKHFYTSDASEKDILVKNSSYGWRFEGTAFTYYQR